jgi:hypothetical protein
MVALASAIVGLGMVPTNAAPSFAAAIADRDGYVSAPEAAAGVAVSWSSADGTATKAMLRFEARLDQGPMVPGGCGPIAVPVNGSSRMEPACARNLPQGPFHMVVDWYNVTGTVVGKAEAASVKDTVPPVGAVDIIDPNRDGRLDPAEVASGKVSAQWHSLDRDTVSASVRFVDKIGRIPTGCGPFPGGFSGTVALNTTCGQNLPEGEFIFRATFTDVAGNVSNPAEISFLKDTTREALGRLDITVLDGTDNVEQGQFDKVANIVETDEGRTLKVVFDLSAVKAPDLTRASVIVVDRNGSKATGETPSNPTFKLRKSDPEDKRTVSVDVRKLADGPLKVIGSVEDALGNITETKVDSGLDLHAPVTKVTAPADDSGATSLPNIGITAGALGTGVTVNMTFNGESTDTPAVSSIKTVYVEGQNEGIGFCTDCEYFKAEAVLAQRDSTTTKWTFSAGIRATGDWNFTITAVDAAGNVEAKSKDNTRHILVIGATLNQPD